MIDVLAPLGLVLLAVLVAAVVVSARRQRSATRELFRRFAEETDRRYLPTDDGTAQSLGDGFEGFGSFSSPSLGPRPPAPVVVGRTRSGIVCHFTHGVRRTQGDARQWTVCVIAAGESLSPQPMVVRPREIPDVSRVGADPVVTWPDDVAFDGAFEVRSADPEAARRYLRPDVRDVLVGGAGDMPFPVEVQIRDRRVAVAPAERNADVDTVGDLGALEALAAKLVEASG